MGNRIISEILAIVVVIIVAVTCVPIWMDSAAADDTYTNAGYIRMTKITDADAHTFIWSSDSPNAFTVDDEVYNLSEIGPNLDMTLIGDTNILIRLKTTADATLHSWTFIYPGNTQTITPDNPADINLVFQDGAYSGYFKGDRAGTYEILFMPDKTGDYVMKSASDLAYLNGDSEIFGIGRSYLRGSAGTQIQPGFRINGSIDDGVTVEDFRGSHMTVSDIEIHDAEVSDHKDLYLFDKVTFAGYSETVDGDGNITETFNGTFTYNYICVPFEVTAERSVHMDSVSGGLVSVLPLLIIVAVILGGAYIFLRSRD